jgi:peroxiredoxin Q/BCP
MTPTHKILVSFGSAAAIAAAGIVCANSGEAGPPVAYASAMIAELPAVGEMAPAFDLPASTGENIKLADYKGKTVVVYFYPKADTPGCTTEACGFRDSADEYKKAGVEIVGISPDPVEDVKAFAEKFQLNFPLLADADHKVCEAYGVWQERSMAGRSFMGAARTTFVVGPDGKITHVFEKVKPAGHEKEVLEAIKAGKKQ